MDSRLGLPENTILDGGYRIARVVGSGGFGITYEAEDINLATHVAIKEYYPFDFGDRDATMSVRPRSDRHKSTFDWGRSNFLLEARTLARFEHPSIVRVSRVFEANSTAYMVMRFEQGKNFEAWLKALGRPPTQEELDRIAAPLLDALEMMHAQNFLHRDIAPDNIIVRPDGTPVLLDFGTARRAVAEKSRALTGIVKAGYSPQEQYASDSRLQGPWSDLYAFGGTLYRAVTGKAPEEATLRFDEDHMASGGAGREGQLSARLSRGHRQPASRSGTRSGRARWRSCGRCCSARGKRRCRSPSGWWRRRARRTTVLPGNLPVAGTVRRVANYWPAIAAVAVVLGGIVGGFAYTRWQSGERDRLEAAAEAKRRQRAGDTARGREDCRGGEATGPRRRASTPRSARRKRRRSGRRRRSATIRRASAICPAAADLRTTPRPGRASRRRPAQATAAGWQGWVGSTRAAAACRRTMPRRASGTKRLPR